MDLFDRVIKIDKTATEFGFAWEHHSQLIEQLLSEVKEVEEVIDHPDTREHLEDELGDLIFTAIALCVYCQFDPATTLSKSLDKFQRRFDALQKVVHEKSLTSLHHQPMSVLKAFWDEAKKRTKT